MSLALIVPGPFDLVSGGYIYDRRVVTELRATGHDVTVMEVDGLFPLADAAAQASVRAAWARCPPEAAPVIDGLALPAFEGMEDALAARGAVGLIHHPVSLETGWSEADQTRLETIERRLLPCFRSLIVTSETTAETLAARFLIPPGRVRVVVPGTDDAPRSPGSADASGTQACEVLSIGTLIPRKGHDVLIRALARLFDLDWRLTIVGSPDRDPPHARGLLALAEELGVAARVRFAGELVGEALEAVWRDADLFALTTRYEGFGMVIAEALKRGLPLVVTNGGAAGSLLTPECGCVCPVGDGDQVSKSLRRLIFGAELRREMADAAWEVGRGLPSWTAQAALFAGALA